MEIKKENRGRVYKSDFDGSLKRLVGIEDTNELQLEIFKNYNTDSENTFYNIIDNYNVMPDFQSMLNPEINIELIPNEDIITTSPLSNEDIVNQVAEFIWEDETDNPNKDFYQLEKAPEGGVMIGPGLKTLSKLQKEYIQKHNNIVSREILDKWLKEKINDSINNLKLYFKKDWDKIPDRYKMGLLDLRHQLGSLNGFPKLLQGIKNNDLKTIQNEIKVTWRDPKTHKKKFDERRYNLRLKRYFYRHGGKINYINLFNNFN